MVGTSGAAGQYCGIRLLQALRAVSGFEMHLVISQAARIAIAQETGWKTRQGEPLAGMVNRPTHVSASIAVGSIDTEALIVAQFSVKSLSAIAHGLGGDLISRAADVHLKDGRPLLLIVRETPLHEGHRESMLRAACIGCIIFPPVPALYGRRKAVDDIVSATFGRMLFRAG